MQVPPEHRDIVAQILRYEPTDINFALKACGWNFGRGRPATESIIQLVAARYPHWLPRILGHLQTHGALRTEKFKTLPPDWADDTPQVSAPAPSPKDPTPAPSVDTSALRDTIAKLINRTDRIERQHESTEAALVDIRANLATLAAELETLRQRAPVQFTIEGVKLPPIEGQHFNFARMVKWLELGQNVLLIGPAGTGKTTAAIKFAELKGLEFYAQPLTMDAFGVFGYTSPDGRIIDTEFSRAWKHGGVFLWDEMSMSSADALGALNAALANKLAPLPGVGTIPPHPSFYMIGADNADTGASLKFAARTLLDGASLDRFVRIEWPIDPEVESSMAHGFSDWLAAVRAIREFIESREIQHVGATPRAVLAGAKALKSGLLTRREILEDTCKKGILARDNWNDVLRLPAVRAFLEG